MSREWIEITVQTAADPAEVLSLLNNSAVCGVWQEDGLLRFYWPALEWEADHVGDLCLVLGRLGYPVTEQAVAIDRVPERDWNERWARSVQPIRIGRVIIRPSWHQVELMAGDVELILDPKQAFGTGHHATTHLLIEWLQELVAGGETVLDLGTGSGILAMTALRLGAGRAIGIDHDPVAIDCAREYAGQNAFGKELSWVIGPVTSLCGHAPYPVHLVVANLDWQTLLDGCEVLAFYAERGTALLLSGLLDEQWPHLAQALARRGIYVRAVRKREGWVALDAAAGLSCEEAPGDVAR